MLTVWTGLSAAAMSTFEHHLKELSKYDVIFDFQTPGMRWSCFRHYTARWRAARAELRLRVDKDHSVSPQLCSRKTPVTSLDDGNSTGA